MMLSLLLLLAAPEAVDENLRGWKHIFAVAASDGPLHAKLVLPPAVFGAARPDLGDLRLADAKGKAIPYALRVREQRNVRATLPVRPFDSVALPDGSERLSLDLGEKPPEHNEIRLDVTATSYGRAVILESSEDGKAWGRLLDGKELIYFKTDRQHIDQREFGYPASRVRFLRVTLKPDVVNKEKDRVLKGAEVGFTFKTEGETAQVEARVARRDPVRSAGQASSAYELDLGAERVPVSRLSLRFDSSGFSRPFVLETLDEGRQQLATGTIRKSEGSDAAVEIEFPEARARLLRLTVIDSRNASLHLREARAYAAARVLVFPATAGARLYAGNPEVAAPNYDFAERLPAEPGALRAASVGEMGPNPDYVAPPSAVVPWTERNRWLLDAALVAALAALGWILLRLARNAEAQSVP